ncbi:MAG TPA: hypothetical protein VHN59_07705 [Chitinophagaceae bacterium]|nr:hypothetical protein [Chitinophagaceae bacterium]
MKKICFLLLVSSFARIENASAQSAMHTAVAERITGKLKDSLFLSNGQRDSIYAINMLLSGQKNNLRSIYQDMDSLQIYTQRVEHTRDSLYRPILGEEKYLLYKQKKRNLISNQ